MMAIVDWFNVVGVIEHLVVLEASKWEALARQSGEGIVLLTPTHEYLPLLASLP